MTGTHIYERHSYIWRIARSSLG